MVLLILFALNDDSLSAEHTSYIIDFPKMHVFSH